MDFSSSFNLGTSTLLNIENAERKVPVKRSKTIEQMGKPAERLHEVIDESPTNKKKSCKDSTSKSKENSRDALTQLRSKRRAFKRNKSDSILVSKPPPLSSVSAELENLSDCFKGSVDFGVLSEHCTSGQLNVITEQPVVDVHRASQQNYDELFAESINFSDRIRLSVNKSNSVINIEDSSFKSNDCSQSEDLFLERPIFSEDIDQLDMDFASEMPLVETPAECRRQPVVLQPDDMINVDELSFMFANKDIASLTTNSLAAPSAGAPSPQLLKLDSESMINVEELSFMFANNQELCGEHKAVLRNSLLPSKKKVQSVMRSEESCFSASQGRPTNFTIINSQESNEINMSKCSNRLLNWSVSSQSEYSPQPANEVLQVAKEEPPVMIRDLESLKDISAWNLPPGILKEYRSKKILKMFDWQVECLSNPKVLFDRSNLVYSAPTSAGKTLVSELLTIKTIIERKKKALIILPFISVVREKMCYLQDLLTSSGYRVDGFFGGYSAPGGFESINVAICTIEKANSIVNKLLEQQKLQDIGIIVVDEIHLISDPGRGYILELLLAKVIYICRKYSLNIQIVGMSATLSNIKLLQKWLQAEFYVSDFRPVELQEMIKIGTKIFNSKMEFIREIKCDVYKDIAKDPDNIAQLCIETILANCSVIVFCPSKDWCETLCLHLASSIVNVGKAKTPLGEQLRLQIKKEELEEVRIQLKNCPAGLDSVLAKTVSYACAFHHAGLTSEERDIVESSFKNCSVKVLVATSTLSSGINLPARRVIIRSPLFAGKKMNPLTYKQMIGRAGRTGKDTLGESILVCTDVNAKTGKELVCSELLPIASCLNLESSMPLKRALLEVISSGVATTKRDVNNFLECTLLHTEKAQLNDSKELRIDSESQLKNNNPLAESLKFLIEYEFIRLQMNEAANEMNYVATRLGMACLSSSLPPNDGLLLFSELQKSRRCFVLESDLHAVYLVTPYSVCYQVHELDWLLYLDMFEKLSASMKRVAELVGVKESFLVRAMRGQTKLDFKALQIHKRFYTALALQELVNEVPINTVALKYKCSRGLLQSLQQMSSTFAGIVTSFCTALNWTLLALIVGEFKERLFFGVHRDLIDLMRISDLNGQKARVLYDAGVTSLVDLASIESFALEKILFNCISFDSEKKREDEDEYDANKRNAMRCLYITGKSGLTIKEAAKLLISNARQYLQYEIGVECVQWTSTENKTVAMEVEEVLDVVSEPVKTDNIVPSSSSSSKERINELQSVTSKSKSPKTMVKSSPRLKTVPTLTPRRSPRNHRSSKREITNKTVRSLKTEGSNSNSPNHNSDIFNDSSFNIDSQMANVLDKKNSQPVKVKETKIDSHINKSIEEIAGSQSAKIVQSKSLRSGNSTRLTRLKLTQKFPHSSSVDKRLAENIINKKNSKENTSNSVELSDCASSSLLHNPIDLNSSHILSTSKTEATAASFNCIAIVDMCGNAELFKKCADEILSAKQIGLSVAVQTLNYKRRPLIGANLLINQVPTDKDDSNIDFVFNDEFYVAGISFCTTSNTSLFLNLQNLNNENQIERTERMRFVTNLVENENLILRIFDAKEQLKVLKKILPTLNLVRAKIEDPKIANWLLEPDKELSLSKIVHQYASECSKLMSLAGVCMFSQSIGLNHTSSIVGRVRSAIESCVTLHILEGQIENLDRIANGNLRKFFHELEMPVQCSLWKMESIGFPIDESELGNLSKHILEVMKKIERKIYELHGSRFSLTSTSAVARVLGLHKKSSGKLSTAKQILEKIDSPLANLILNYRKLGATLNKTIQPLIKSAVNERIHGNSITFTATGRISMHEPNLQNVAKDFTVEIPGHNKYLISCRSSFACKSGKCLLSVDFCQLEMRILTHLSQDSILAEIMHSEEDIFRTISARWNKISDEDVSQKMRDGTKQICYGIIYGMGMRSLAEALKCNDEEAMTLVEQFHSVYPGIRNYTHKVIKFAKQNGYVETITGRRRYLPHITNTDETLKGQAERQALNTTIQGSAADIAKKAILRTERNLLKYSSKIGIGIDDVQFVLHLHDELIFEVAEDKVKNVAKILRASMENCAQLNVPLRVKVKVGRTWGTLKEF